MSSAAATLLLRRATGTATTTIGPKSTSASCAAVAKRTLAAAASDEPLRKTALNDLHKELGGDIVPFAGYELPVLYKGGENGGVMKEHLWCRAEGKASLFDVSHMGQVGFAFYQHHCMANVLSSMMYRLYALAGTYAMSRV